MPLDFPLVRAWRCPRQDERNGGPSAGLALEGELATQPLRDDGVDNVQTEAGCAAMAGGREKRIERQPLDLRRHAAAIVGYQQFDMVGPGRSHPDIDGSVEL